MHYVWILIIIVGLIAVLLAFFLTKNTNNNTTSVQLTSDFAMIKEIMITDAHLHRLLMIEIIQDKDPSKISHTLSSETVTFEKMTAGMGNLNKALVKSFGVNIAQRITTLMQQRNDILREYYRALHNMTCETGECVITTEDKMVPVFPSISLLSYQQSILDVTTISERKLQNIAREITDQVTAFFDIKDVQCPIIHFQRLFNLIAMYDKELINQAKSYVSQQYIISMNCAQSSLEISNHISDELCVLIKQSYERVKTNP